MDPNISNGDSDGEPEEISKKDSEAKAKETLKNEKLSRNALREKIKEKRRRILARNIEQKQNKFHIERLPDDLLDQIEFTFTNEQIKKSNEIIKKTKKKNIHKDKSFETESTRFQVFDFDEIKKTKVPIALTAALDFRERMLYDRKRNKRINSEKIELIRLKRKAYNK